MNNYFTKEIKAYKSNSHDDMVDAIRYALLFGSGKRTLWQRIRNWFIWIFIVKRLARKLEQSDRDIGIPD